MMGLMAQSTTVPPVKLISVAVIGFYLVGDGLRDALDPRSINRSAQRNRKMDATK